MSTTSRRTGRWRLFLNAGYNLSEQQLRNYWSQFGVVSDVYLPKHPSGRNKGYGFVTFECETAMVAALTLPEHVVDGQVVRINQAGPRPEPQWQMQASPQQSAVRPTVSAPPATTSHGKGPRLYVGGIPDEIGEEKIRQHFAKWGEVVDVYFPGKKGQQRVNYCFVTFESWKAAHAACMQSQRVIDGMPIQSINVAEERSTSAESQHSHPTTGSPPKSTAGGTVVGSPPDGFTPGAVPTAGMQALPGLLGSLPGSSTTAGLLGGLPVTSGLLGSQAAFLSTLTLQQNHLLLQQLLAQAVLQGHANLLPALQQAQLDTTAGAQTGGLGLASLQGLGLQNPGNPLQGLGLQNPGNPLQGLGMQNPGTPLQGLGQQNPGNPLQSLQNALNPLNPGAAPQRPHAQGTGYAQHTSDGPLQNQVSLLLQQALSQSELNPGSLQSNPVSQQNLQALRSMAGVAGLQTQQPSPRGRGSSPDTAMSQLMPSQATGSHQAAAAQLPRAQQPQLGQQQKQQQQQFGQQAQPPRQPQQFAQQGRASLSESPQDSQGFPVQAAQQMLQQVYAGVEHKHAGQTWQLTPQQQSLWLEALGQTQQQAHRDQQHAEVDAVHRQQQRRSSEQQWPQDQQQVDPDAAQRHNQRRNPQWLQQGTGQQHTSAVADLQPSAQGAAQGSPMATLEMQLQPWPFQPAADGNLPGGAFSQQSSWRPISVSTRLQEDNRPSGHLGSPQDDNRPSGHLGSPQLERRHAPDPGSYVRQSLPRSLAATAGITGLASDILGSAYQYQSAPVSAAPGAFGSASNGLGRAYPTQSAPFSLDDTDHKQMSIDKQVSQNSSNSEPSSQPGSKRKPTPIEGAFSHSTENSTCPWHARPDSTASVQKKLRPGHSDCKTLVHALPDNAATSQGEPRTQLSDCNTAVHVLPDSSDTRQGRIRLQLNKRKTVVTTLPLSLPSSALL